MIRFLIRPKDPRLLILSQISSETNRFTGHFDLLPRISRTVTNRTSDPLLIPSNHLFHSDSLELPSFSSLSLSLIGDDRLVVRVIVKIMIRVGRPGNRCRAWIGCTLSLLPSSHLFDTSVYIYTCDHFQPLDLAFDLDNWPSIIPNDHVSPNKRCSIDNLALRVILFFLEANFRMSFLPLVLFLIPNENISSFSIQFWDSKHSGSDNVLETGKIHFQIYKRYIKIYNCSAMFR